MKPALYLKGDYPYDIEEELESIDVIGTLEALDELLEYLDELADREIVVAVDTETVDVNPAKESPAGKGRIVTTQVSWIEEADTTALEDLVDAIMEGDVEPTRVWIDCRDPAMVLRLKEWCEREDAPKCLHNEDFDKHQFQNHGVALNGVVGDTLIMSRAQYPERMSHSFDGEMGLIRRTFDDKRLTTKQALGVFKLKKDGEDGKAVEFRDMLTYVDDDDMRPFQQVYSTFDVYDTIRLFYVLQWWMRQMEWEDHEDGFWAYWYQHGGPLIEVLIRMERRGVRVDVPVVDQLRADYQAQEDVLTETIYGIIGVPMNLNSSPQKAWALYGKGPKEFKRAKKDGGPFVITGLELPCKEIVEEDEDPWQQKRRKDGKWMDGYPSTDKDHLDWTLERIDRDADEAELLQTIRDRQELNKLISGTLDPLKRNLRPRHKTGLRPPKEGVLYVHGSFSPVARTGRLASRNPNLQNVPSRTYLGKRIRHAFTCEEDEAFLVADYEQLELNILSWYLASLFGDTSYAELLRAGDIHQITADALGIKRYGAKAVNFGILYGMTEFKLAIQLGISLPEARDILYRYYEQYPYVEQYGEWAVKYAKRTGSARTMLGRYRQLEFINETYRGGRRRGFPTGLARADERRAKNTPIQGSAQDIVGTAMLLIDADEELKDYGYEMNIQVHDELGGTCKAKFRDKALTRKVYLMETAVEFPEYNGIVKFPVSGHTGLTWGEGKGGCPFTCFECDGRGKRPGESDDCPVCAGEGEFTVEKANELWIARAA